MKKNFYWVIMPLFLYACGEKRDVPMVKTVYHIHTLQMGEQKMPSEEYTSTFYYDAENNFLYSVFMNGAKTTRKQEGNRIVFEETDSTQKLLRTTEVLLNENEEEDSMTLKQGNEVLGAVKFIYNSKGYLIEERQYERGRQKFIIRHTPVDGNSIRDSLIYTSAKDTQVYTNPSTGQPEAVVVNNENMIVHKEYNLDKQRVPSNINFGSKMKDRASYNLEKRDVVTNSKGDTINIVNYRFTFDEKGRVIAAAHDMRGGSEYDSVAYTYY